MIPDIKVIIYINEVEVSEIPTTSSYTLNETLSTCTNSEATIDYEDSTKEVIVSSGKSTECNVYLEGV